MAVRKERGEKMPEKETLTKLGYPLGVVASALQKEIRRGDVEAGVKRDVPSYVLDMHTREGKAAGASVRDWFAGRVAMGIPVNEYTKRIWALKPEWAPVTESGEGVLSAEKEKP